MTRQGQRPKKQFALLCERVHSLKEPRPRRAFVRPQVLGCSELYSKAAGLLTITIK